MTREEFLRESEDWDLDRLVDFARDHEVAGWEDIYAECDLDGCVCDDIRDAMSHLYWHQIRDKLGEIESGYEYYMRGGSFEYSPLDEYDLREDIICDMDEYELWDEPEEDEEDEEEPEDDEDPDDDFGLSDPEPAEPEIDEVQKELMTGIFSIDEFIASGAGDMMVLREDAERIAELRGKTEEASASIQTEPPRQEVKFAVGDTVKANAHSNGRYAITCEANNWTGVVTKVGISSITVKGRGNSDYADMDFTVDPRCFDLYHDETYDVPEEELFVF